MMIANYFIMHSVTWQLFDLCMQNRDCVVL